MRAYVSSPCTHLEVKISSENSDLINPSHSFYYFLRKSNRERRSAASTSSKWFSGIQFPVLGSLIQENPSLFPVASPSAALITLAVAATACSCPDPVAVTGVEYERRPQFTAVVLVTRADERTTRAAAGAAAAAARAREMLICI
ncbi:hypothetical protein GUJ93_ZPchr0008g12441 [Zizania palustris]|uniref:Uncharacterized protein n=1 Tax=Zizania palustris TaxID=103762 RepID=A0A8J5QZT8_ZIZPA|nr:hypothetical protein GUJ93_ZPchr0008g12441 [Zizania palustris]